MSLGQDELSYIQKLVRDCSGIAIETGKEYLIESRLARLWRREGHRSIKEFVAHLKTKSFSSLHSEVALALATHETAFFRDASAFEALRERILPEMLERRAPARSLNLWSSACSSGQEPYSVALALCEAVPDLANWSVRLLASDMSPALVSRAVAGVYRKAEVERGLPAHLRDKYFERNGDDWQAVEYVRRMIEFRTINLVETWPMLPRMDIVLMRHVLIYFDVPTKRKIFGKLRRILRPDGFVFLGAGETTIGVDDALEPIDTSTACCYRLSTHAAQPGAS
ncbi:MAG: protein-glutamate O-methyltransferase CheR [Proteobacteria bacterium]|nr:protein-glutamate O-methyltransferase CheR [Pseudomonadota bacterium]